MINIARRISAVAATLTLAAALLIMSASTAHADQLEISSDGRTWVDDLSDPVFDPGLRWVPGDDGQESFWVRNTAATAGDLSLTVEVAPGDELIGTDVVELRVRTGGSDWMEIERLGQPQSLQRRLAPGEEEEIVVTAEYRGDAGNETQRDRTELSFTATLTDASAGEPSAPPTDGPTSPPAPGPDEPGPDEPAPPPGGDLPDTGAGPVLWLLPVGAAAIGIGVSLLRRGREARDG